MNERIKELALTSQLHSVMLLNYYGKMDALTDSEQEDFQKLERFAELIVRECGVALSPMLRDMVSRGQAYELIKQHFGVD